MGEFYGKSEKRKTYSRFTAQIIRNSVRKKISNVKIKGKSGAEELLAAFLSPHKASHSNSSGLEDKIGEIIEKNKHKWCDFIVNVAKSFDSEALTIFGTNLIYGGMVTETLGGTSWSSLLEVNEQTNKRISSVAELISGAQSRRSFVWIVKGKGGILPNLTNVYASFPDSAFMIALPEGDLDSVRSTATLQRLKSTKNILILVDRGRSPEKGYETADILQRNGILCALSADRDLFDYRSENSREVTHERAAADAFHAPTATKGNAYPKLSISTEGNSIRSEGIPGFLSDLLTDPHLPLAFDGIKASADNLEFFLSGGKRHSIPRYSV